jgi:PAS domain S-box-containing protein
LLTFYQIAALHNVDDYQQRVEGGAGGTVSSLKPEEKESMEQALKDSEARFRSILENSIDTLYQRDLETGRFTYVSPAVKTLLGFPVNKVLSWDMEAILRRVHPDDRERIRMLKVSNTTGAGPVTIDYRIRHRNGKYKWVSDKFLIVRDSDGKPLYREALYGISPNVRKRRKSSMPSNNDTRIWSKQRSMQSP